MKKHLIYIITILVTILTSCSSDYRNAIPSDSTALISIDATDEELGKRLSLLNDLLDLDDPKESGIDFRDKVYLFETADGNLGLCAKVHDDKDLREVFVNLEKEGKAHEESERQKCNFFTVADKFIAGYNTNTLLIMGPVVAAAKGEAINLIARYLNQEAEDGIVGSPMMDKLDSLPSAMSIVAQATALPKQLSSVLTLGMPKDADPSQCILAADIDFKGEVIFIQSEPISFNPQLNKKLQSAYASLRPIGDKYLHSLSQKAIGGLFANIKGDDFLPLLQQSQSIWALLAGINAAIDMNAILKSIDGNVLISVPSFSVNSIGISLAAELADNKFLNDIDYWKQSVPAGSKLAEWQKNAYCYTSDNMSFYFGTTDGTKKEFYSGPTQAEAIASIHKTTTPLDKDVIASVAGKRLALIVSISALLPEKATMSTMMLPQMLKLRTVVYTVK